MSKDQTQVTRCDCGNTEVTVTSAPIVRIYCHCEFCQDFNQAPYGDVCAFSPKAVEITKGRVEYKTYSPLVRRGACVDCGKPAIELTAGIGSLRVAAIPSANFENTKELPEAACHGFYHRRQADANDNLPKYSGLIKSELGFGRHMLTAFAKRAVGK